ncbi:MAG: F0F1 ATP synthase subunit A [bacterium]|nr:F0F1 ATP synthase subunit A [bacterium]
MTETLHLAPGILQETSFLPITNTLFVTWIATFILLCLSFLATRRMRLVPNGAQNAAELVVESFYNLTASLSSYKKARTIVPLVLTFFLFILTANWLGLLPGFGTIGRNVHGEFIPYLRAPTSDLNVTLSLALVSVALTHFLAIRYLGFKGYLHKWFSLNPIFLFVGFLELIGEVTKLVSLSFRLFGNIFAGEVVLGTISGLFAFIAPLPFYALEVIVGLVQAAVFAILTLVFIVVLSEKSH